MSKEVRNSSWQMAGTMRLQSDRGNLKPIFSKQAFLGTLSVAIGRVVGVAKEGIEEGARSAHKGG